MSNAPQSRKWLLTINNPSTHGITREVLEQIFETWDSIKYWCVGDETGEEGTYHSHLFIYSTSGIRFTTVKKRFPMAHIDFCNGTCMENRNYCFKDGEKFNKEVGTGVYDYTDSAGKHHRGTHYDTTNFESNECPIERQGSRNDLARLYNMIADGMSNAEILQECPEYIRDISNMEMTRQALLEEKYKDVWRDLDVTYIWGLTGTGKTRGVMEKYGYSNVYRVSDYKHPFDSYKGQDVIVFEEFRSDLTLSEMLNYLDGYPVELPCRYVNKRACYTKVYITTNVDLREQYYNQQTAHKQTWDAFLRRIHKVVVYTGENTFQEFETQDYLKNGWFFFKPTPFGKDGEEDV